MRFNSPTEYSLFLDAECFKAQPAVFRTLQFAVFLRYAPSPLKFRPALLSGLASRKSGLKDGLVLMIRSRAHQCMAHDANVEMDSANIRRFYDSNSSNFRPSLVSRLAGYVAATRI